MAEESWADLSSAVDARKSGQLLQAFKAFLAGWESNYKILPEFKIVVADMHTFLTDARLWLEKAVIGLNLSASTAVKFRGAVSFCLLTATPAGSLARPCSDERI